jgi:hypothetical protein
MTNAIWYTDTYNRIESIKNPSSIKLVQYRRDMNHAGYPKRKVIQESELQYYKFFPLLCINPITSQWSKERKLEPV